MFQKFGQINHLNSQYFYQTIIFHCKNHLKKCLMFKSSQEMLEDMREESVHSTKLAQPYVVIQKC